MLEAVVEQVNALPSTRQRLRLGQRACVVAPESHINRHARLAGDQQRLVAEVFGASAGEDASGQFALAAVAAAEHVHAQAARAERLGQRDGERRLARAAGGEIADADHRKAQPPRRLQEKPQFTRGERQPVERNQRQQQTARGGGLVHAGGSIPACAASNSFSASTQRPVAPAWLEKTCLARLPIAWATLGSWSSSIKTAASSSLAAMRTA